MITLIACSRHIYVWCCSSRTSHSWWITQSTQHHQRGCSNAIDRLINLFGGTELIVLDVLFKTEKTPGHW